MFLSSDRNSGVLAPHRKQPEVNFQGDFMGILGDILKCSKPDDCDVTHSAEANILHTSLCHYPHILCSDTSSAHSHLESGLLEKQDLL